MFGFMKSKSCSLGSEQRLHRRLHYCGTCKTIGRLYGQRTRVFLNNDAVFLGELLSDLSGAGVGEEWLQPYRSYNCFSLPHDPEEMPLSLKFAATVAVMMADFKIADRIADPGGFGWTLGRRLFSRSFRTAASALNDWGFPLSRLRECSENQDAREREVPASREGRSAGQLLDYLAEPTARATAVFFEHGAKLVGAAAAAPRMYLLGSKFGSLVYILDALEDFDDDRRAGAFNALAAAYQISESLPTNCRDHTRRKLVTTAEEIQSLLMSLPIPRDRARIFIARLQSNLANRLGVALPVLAQLPEPNAPARNHVLSKGQTVSRWRTAVSVGRTMVERHSAATGPSARARFEMPFVFLTAAAVGLMLPHQAGSASSYRECMGMAVNLMFVGGLARSVLGTPLRFSAPVGPGPSWPPKPQAPGDIPSPGDIPPQPPKPRSSCGVCCCDADCCCDCGDCCDCCDCCSCCSCCDC